MTIYNPHLLARQELIETFVARQPLLDEFLDDLRRGGKQHHLLIGGRGSGKTTLLLRLATAIEDDKQLTRKCIPLRFPEEQYNVSRPSDFWMNAIDALADALERQGDRAAARRMESSLTELEPLDETERAKRSLALLESWAKQTKRLIVLLIDNLDLVLDRLSRSLWELREALSLDNRLVVIGASSRFVEETIDYQSPFYDFFRAHELGPLSEEEARAVVLSLAQRANTPKVAEVLEHDPGRFKALFVLTGGTPRTLALLHTVLALEQHDSVERDLDGLLDQLTPYYKARFDDLPAQSQVIVDKVALHWHPITAAGCQAATRLEINVVSAQLSRLVKSGVLTKVELPGPGKLGFQLSERFFNIWYLMRASRRLRRRLSWFVEFLRIFYGEEDLRRRAEELIRAAPAGSLTSPAQLLAFAAAVGDEPLRRRLEFKAIGLVAAEGASTLHEIMDLEGEDVHLVPVINRVRALQEIRTRITRANINWIPGHTAMSVAETIAREPLLSITFKQRLAVGLEGGERIISDLFTQARQSLVSGIGDKLLSAIASGEVPAPADVSTRAEMSQILELGASLPYTIVALITATEVGGQPLSDDLFHDLLATDPEALTSSLFTAQRVLIGMRDWPHIRQRFLFLLRYGAFPPSIDYLVDFFSACHRAGLTREALDLIVEAGKSEEWAPLHEGLGAAAEGSQARLRSLAPEMRAIAQRVYEQIIMSGITSRPPGANKPAPRKGKPPRRGPTAKTLESRPARPGPTEGRRSRNSGRPNKGKR